MIKRARKSENSGSPEKNQNQGDFSRIIDGLKAHEKIIADALKSRVNPGDWKIWQTQYALDEENGSVDLIFVADEGKKATYTLIDLSIPHLGYGQKYALPAKAKAFQKMQNIPATRIKKAIVLIRKGTETISASSSRIRCPIIEVQLERIMPREPKPAPERSEVPATKQAVPVSEKSTKPVQGVSQELLFALKEAIVHECLSTMHKRKNKYIRKGLWRWIEREIMDPNVHFYLIILSTIYQGKAGEVLSRRFKTVESYTSQAEEVISAIFSKETNLADEIKKASERHKKALRKFLACFSQTPPFEYLRSLFLKEFRSSQDGLKSRLSVFTTLNQLLERCGFEGEKETQYPLEILDELGIFQGIMAGNYEKLRIDNAEKKLKHLVPQANWSEEEIYLLRNQLSRALNLPAQEFNLNAFLPQAFIHDARVMAEARKEAFRTGPRNEAQARPVEQTEVKAEPQPRIHEKKHQPHPRREEMPRKQPRQPAPQLAFEDAPTCNVEQEAPLAMQVIEEGSKPTNVPAEIEVRTENENRGERPDKKRFNECDEAYHRNFEFFGGQIDEDIDSIRLALAMSRHEIEKINSQPEAPPKVEETDEGEEDSYRPPTKFVAEKHIQTNHVPPKKSHAQNNQPGNGNPKNPNNNRRRRPGNRPGQNRKPRRAPGQDNHGINR
ncbi:MAG: hypothetical protein AB1403_15190 [Candidatus Riflebacteria bacterium]